MLPSDFTSSTIASIDVSNELKYTGFVLVVLSRNIDLAEAGNSNTAFGREGAASTLPACAAMHSGLLANDLEPKGHLDRQEKNHPNSKVTTHCLHT